MYALVIALVFDWLGLIAGNAQAAQGLGILGVPCSLPVQRVRPAQHDAGRAEPIANYQLLTFMINSVRGLMLGDDVTRTFDHTPAFYVVGSLLWFLALAIVVARLAVRAYRRS